MEDNKKMVIPLPLYNDLYQRTGSPRHVFARTPEMQRKPRVFDAGVQYLYRESIHPSHLCIFHFPNGFGICLPGCLGLLLWPLLGNHSHPFHLPLTFSFSTLDCNDGTFDKFALSSPRTTFSSASSTSFFCFKFFLGVISSGIRSFR